MIFVRHFLLTSGAIFALRKALFLKDVCAKMAIFENAEKNKKTQSIFFCKKIIENHHFFKGAILGPKNARI